ncbi:hypothetical protein CVIRNUC_009974 [Coccomyxa viridis]|uniref:Uncharacterized protein n=1 Tax=Coccomyxa viridis TaxID=1274662 RepID=A0AAV1IJX5_9CHLO|nr:hypothetical protein CVIRNUC_009974 [Coccomyxa viridis]
MPLPLWATIVGLSLAKKVTVLIAAKLYGIPRLYRRSQKAVRYSTISPAQRVAWAIRVRKGFRLPENVARRWHGQKPIATEFPFPGLRAADVSDGTRSRTGALSFASAPLFKASRQRLQDRLRANRQRLRVVRAHWKLHSQAWKQRGLQQLQRYGSQARPSVLVEASTMHFIRQARQAYQFVPSVAMR